MIQMSKCSSGHQRGKYRSLTCRYWPPSLACHQTPDRCCTSTHTEFWGICLLPCWIKNGFKHVDEMREVAFQVSLVSITWQPERPPFISSKSKIFSNLQLSDLDIWHPDDWARERDPCKSTFLFIPAQSIYVPYLYSRKINRWHSAPNRDFATVVAKTARLSFCSCYCRCRKSLMYRKKQ